MDKINTRFSYLAHQILFIKILDIIIEPIQVLALTQICRFGFHEFLTPEGHNLIMTVRINRESKWEGVHYALLDEISIHYAFVAQPGGSCTHMGGDGPLAPTPRRATAVEKTISRTELKTTYRPATPCSAKLNALGLNVWRLNSFRELYAY